MDQQLAQYRSEVIRTVETFIARYHQGGNRDQYIAIAQRWSTALQREELDPNELSEIINDAERYEPVADIAF